MEQHTEGKNEKRTLFSITSLKTAINHLKENRYFNFGNWTMKRATGIQIGIDLAPFWTNLFFYIPMKKNVFHH